MRSKRNFTYLIENLFEPQPIFQKIQQKAKLSDTQMYGNYNMGAGFALFAPAKEVKKIISLTNRMEVTAIDAGVIEKGLRKVVIKPLGIEFTGDQLQIR